MTVTRPLAIVSCLAGLLGLFGAASCGGGGGGGGGAAAASADLLIHDAPVDELLSFTATLDSLRLERDDGSRTANLLSMDRRLEFIGLQGVSGWLASPDLASDTYVAVRVEFVPFSYAARARDGSPVTVTALSDELVAALPAPLTVSSGYVRLAVDLNLAQSLTGNVGAGAVVFDPRGTSRSSDGSEDAPIDEIKGLVSSEDPTGQSFVVDAFADGDLSSPLGPITIQVGPTTLLIDDDESVFASIPAFFGAVVPGLTFLEVHGDLGTGGMVSAARVEIEGQSGALDDDTLVRIEGIVNDLRTGELDLLIREVEEGAMDADPVLAGLGDPATIRVAFDGMTRFLAEENMPVDASALAVGQKVKARFAVFAAEPFLATEVELEDLFPEFEGIVQDASGLPASMIIHLKADDPALSSGDVASTSTDVVVTQVAAELFLDTEGEPTLTTDQILDGIEVQVEGELSGTPDMPAIAASKTKIRAGRLVDATVATTSRGTSRFTTTGGDVTDPLGGGLGPGPFDVQIDPAAFFRGDIASAGAFFDAFDALGPGEVLEAEILGIASGVGAEIRAYEIEARVR